MLGNLALSLPAHAEAGKIFGACTDGHGAQMTPQCPRPRCQWPPARRPTASPAAAVLRRVPAAAAHSRAACVLAPLGARRLQPDAARHDGRVPAAHGVPGQGLVRPRGPGAGRARPVAARQAGARQGQRLRGAPALVYVLPCCWVLLGADRCQCCCWFTSSTAAEPSSPAAAAQLIAVTQQVASRPAARTATAAADAACCSKCCAHGGRAMEQRTERRRLAAASGHVR